VAKPGNLFASSSGVRANVVVVYYFQEGQVQRLLPIIFYQSDYKSTDSPFTVLYGNAQANAPNTFVWVSAAVPGQPILVKNGDAKLNTPNIDVGKIDAQTASFAASAQFRVVEFWFSVSLVPA
jgi:hypothetical protein